jgi:hypothetical protein
MINFITNISTDKWFYSSLFPSKELTKEWLRPWNLFILAIGMTWLFYGALNWGYPDWDIGVSIIMGLLTYMLAPWSVSTFIKSIKYKPSGWLLAIGLCILSWLFVVDFSYFLWHTYKGNTMIRYENFIASSFLYLMAGFTWIYKGTFKELLNDIKNIKVENKLHSSSI